MLNTTYYQWFKSLSGMTKNDPAGVFDSGIYKQFSKKEICPRSP